MAMVRPGARELLTAMRAEYAKKKGGSGLQFGPNATMIVLTRAWEDVRKMCVAKGARSETLLSLSGLGDLMLTCFGGRHSTLGNRVISREACGGRGRNPPKPPEIPVSGVCLGKGFRGI